MSIGSQVFYPNVSRVPANPSVADGKAAKGGEQIQKGEFDQSLEQAMKKIPPSQLQNIQATPDLNQLAQGLKFSAHATQRLRERQIQFDPETLAKMNDAITKAESKGVQDTLIITDKAALIVSVPNRTVVTAMDRNNLSGNIFTNIDGAVII